MAESTPKPAAWAYPPMLGCPLCNKPVKPPAMLRGGNLVFVITCEPCQLHVAQIIDPSGFYQTQIPNSVLHKARQHVLERWNRSQPAGRTLYNYSSAGDPVCENT